MEVVAAKPAGDVDDLAYEVKAGNEAGLESAGVEGVGGDAAGGDFGFGIAFGAGGRDAPGVEVAVECGEGRVREWALRACMRGGGVEIEPAGCKALGEDSAELASGGGEVAASVGLGEWGEDGVRGLGRWITRGRARSGACGRRVRWGEVELDRLAGAPVGGDLQDCRAAESAMGDEHLFAERGWSRAGPTGALPCSGLR